MDRSKLTSLKKKVTPKLKKRASKTTLTTLPSDDKSKVPSVPTMPSESKHGGGDTFRPKPPAPRVKKGGPPLA